MSHTKSITAFFWHHIKPYKWYYVVMLMAPLISSFYPFAYNYAIKMFLDVMSAHEVLTFQNVMRPIILFLSIQIALDVIWRISSVAEWLAEPYVRRSIFIESYDYVQHHAYAFFQSQMTGTLSSKIKGIWDGYDKFWAESIMAYCQKCSR